MYLPPHARFTVTLSRAQAARLYQSPKHRLNPPDPRIEPWQYPTSPNLLREDLFVRQLSLRLGALLAIAIEPAASRHRHCLDIHVVEDDHTTGGEYGDASEACRGDERPDLFGGDERPHIVRTNALEIRGAAVLVGLLCVERVVKGSLLLLATRYTRSCCWLSAWFATWLCETSRAGV
jgi:hypothetical protein